MEPRGPRCGLLVRVHPGYILYLYLVLAGPVEARVEAPTTRRQPGTMSTRLGVCTLLTEQFRAYSSPIFCFVGQIGSDILFPQEQGLLHTSIITDCVGQSLALTDGRCLLERLAARLLSGLFCYHGRRCLKSSEPGVHRHRQPPRFQERAECAPCRYVLGPDTRTSAGANLCRASWGLSCIAVA